MIVPKTKSTIRIGILADSAKSWEFQPYIPQYIFDVIIDDTISSTLVGGYHDYLSRVAGTLPENLHRTIAPRQSALFSDSVGKYLYRWWVIDRIDREIIDIGEHLAPIRTQYWSLTVATKDSNSILETFDVLSIPWNSNSLALPRTFEEFSRTQNNSKHVLQKLLLPAVVRWQTQQIRNNK